MNSLSTTEQAEPPLNAMSPNTAMQPVGSESTELSANSDAQQRGPHFKDLSGQRFGRLLVLRLSNIVKRHSYWICLCDCGKEKVVAATCLGRKTSSCGCLRRETLKAMHTTHGHALVGARSSEYVSWSKMLNRCANQNGRDYRWYGAKGVTVHEAWRHDFTAFLAYMGPKPTPKHTIDRIDPFGNYEPGNVRWETMEVQRKNTRRVFLMKLSEGAVA